MASDMRLRVAYLCMCVAELHAVSGSPDIFQLTPELIHVASTLPNLKPTLGFKRNSAASSTLSDETAESQIPAAAPVPSDTSDNYIGGAHVSNKQRKKAMQQVDIFCAPLSPKRFQHVMTRCAGKNGGLGSRTCR